MPAMYLLDYPLTKKSGFAQELLHLRWNGPVHAV